MKWYKKRKYLAVLLIVSSFITGEVIARYALGLGNPPLSIAHPKIEYMFKPNQYVSRFGNNIIINQYGMRSESFAREKHRGELRIMVFGDSVINGGNLTDHWKLATTLLSETLNKEGYQKVVVGNVSAGSWGPGNWLAYVREYGFFGADVIALVISSHDYADNPTFRLLNKNTHPTEKPVSALIEGLTRYLPLYIPSIRKTSNNPETQQNSSSEKIEVGLTALETFLKMAQSHSQKVLVFQHWEKEEIENRTAKPGNLQIKALCEQMSITPLSLEPYFLHAMKKGVNPYRDNIHPNDVGQRLIAEAILEKIVYYIPQYGNLAP